MYEQGEGYLYLLWKLISILNTDAMYYTRIIQDERNYIEIQENYRKNIGIQEE